MTTTISSRTPEPVDVSNLVLLLARVAAGAEQIVVASHLMDAMHGVRIRSAYLAGETVLTPSERNALCLALDEAERLAVPVLAPLMQRVELAAAFEVTRLLIAHWASSPSRREAGGGYVEELRVLGAVYENALANVVMVLWLQQRHRSRTSERRKVIAELLTACQRCATTPASGEAK